MIETLVDYFGHEFFQNALIAGTLSAMNEHEPMNPLSSIAFFQSILTFDTAMTIVLQARCCQLWG